MTTAADVIRVARSYVGTPFLHQGRSRLGLDCVGLPVVVMQDLGLWPADFETPDYGRTPDGNAGELMRRLQEHCSPLTQPEPGSLLAIRWKRLEAHVAIYSDCQTIIHAYSRKPHEAVIEHGFRGRWLNYLAASFALPGVSYV